jgi:hypothetical protein
LNKIFTSLPDGGGSEFVDISELRDVLLRTSKDLIDDETLVKWTELADAECGGTLSFVDFARVYFGSRKEMNISEGGELPAYVGNDSPPSSLKRDSFYNRDSS